MTQMYTEPLPQQEQTTPCFADGIDLCVRHITRKQEKRNETSFLLLVEQPPKINPVHTVAGFGQTEHGPYHIPLPWVYYNVMVRGDMARIDAMCISPVQVGTRSFRPSRLPFPNFSKYNPCYPWRDVKHEYARTIQQQLHMALHTILLWQDSAMSVDHLFGAYRSPLAREIAEMAHYRYGDLLYRAWPRPGPCFGVDSFKLWRIGFCVQLFAAWEKLTLTDIMDLSYPSGGTQDGLDLLWERDFFFPSCFAPDGRRNPQERHSL